MPIALILVSCCCGSVFTDAGLKQRSIVHSAAVLEPGSPK